MGPPLVGQARVIRWGRRGAGGRLGERTGSTWSRANDRRRSGGAVGERGDYLKGREEAADGRGGREARGLRDFGFVLSSVHLSFLGERAICGRGGERGFGLCQSGTGRTGGVRSRMIVPTIGTLGGTGGAATSDRAEVALLGAGGVGVPVLRLLVMKSADGTDRVIVLADRSGVPVPLTVAAAGGFVGGVSDFDLPLTREVEDVGAHLFSFLGSGSNHHRRGVFDGPSVGIRVKEASGGDHKTLSVEYGGFEVDKQPLRVTGQEAERKAVYGELVFVRGRAEREPG